MVKILEFFVAYSPFILQLTLAVIGGGIISAYLTERWTRRRERQAIFFEHLASLIRSYHVYVRALNQVHSDRSSIDLDHAHATFYSEAKLLGLSETLKVESDELLVLADDLFSIRANASEVKPEVEQDLQPIFMRFAELLDRIKEKL